MLNEVKEELEATAAESEELTEKVLGDVTGGSAPLADEPEGETLGEGDQTGLLPASLARKREKDKAQRQKKNRKFY